MPFEVLADEVGVLRKIGNITDDHDEHETITRYKGEVLQDEDVAPTVQKLYDDGDPHTRSVLKRVRARAKATDAEDEGDAKASSKEPAPAKAKE